MGYGMYLITSVKEGKPNVQIANVVFQVTSQPIQLAICVNKHNLTHEYIESSGVFGVSILSEDTPMTFIGKFGFKSGRDTDKFSFVAYDWSSEQIPLVTEHSVGVIALKVVSRLELLTHTLIVGEVLQGRVLNEKVPMTYAHYHLVKKGISPEFAPTFVSIKERSQKMEHYVCAVCGYEYDPSMGDPDGMVESGTPFEDIPDDWVCPVCGVGKDQFKPLA